MNLKNKLRLGFFMIILLVAIYLLIYYFYDNTDRRDLGQGILVELFCDSEV